MIGDLYINGKDCWFEWGVSMGNGFLDAIDSFVPTKAFIENESRAEDGKRVLVVAPRVASRDLTLHFTICGENEYDFRYKKNAFEQELRSGMLEVVVPSLGYSVYRLIYTGKNVTYRMSKARNFCAFSAKFEEPNPADRAKRA